MDFFEDAAFHYAVKNVHEGDVRFTDKEQRRLYSLHEQAVRGDAGPTPPPLGSSPEDVSRWQAHSEARGLSSAEAKAEYCTIVSRASATRTDDAKKVEHQFSELPPNIQEQVQAHLLAARGGGNAHDVDGLFFTKRKVVQQGDAVSRAATDIFEAARVDDFASAKRLLSDESRQNNLEARDEELGLTPLLLAVDSGSENVALLLLEAKADPNCLDDEEGRSTPLHYAAMVGRPALLSALLLAGADPTAKDGDGKTPLEIAEREKQGELSDMLKSR